MLDGGICTPVVVYDFVNLFLLPGCVSCVFDDVFVGAFGIGGAQVTLLSGVPSERARAKRASASAREGGCWRRRKRIGQLEATLAFQSPALRAMCDHAATLP